MAAHAPHVRTKRPLHGRRPRLGPHASLPLAGHHAPSPHHVVPGRVVRRGPPVERSLPIDNAFRIAAGAVILAAALLGVALGLAQPSWLLAAALVGMGALLVIAVAIVNGLRSPLRPLF